MKNGRRKSLIVAALYVLVLSAMSFMTYATLHLSVLPAQADGSGNPSSQRAIANEESAKTETLAGNDNKNAAGTAADLKSAENSQEGNIVRTANTVDTANSESALHSAASQIAPADLARIGQELAVVRHLQDGEEYTLPLQELLRHGEQLFAANWTVQEGAGRPLTKGTGMGIISDQPLRFPRNMNRISGPDANSCAGCHNMPFGIVGGGGDFATNVFALAQRFDFATFDPADDIPISGAVDENLNPVTLQTIGNNRATLGMFGAGYIEMLARQMTYDLQAIRDQIAPNQSAPLISKGVSFGVLSRDGEGNWDVSKVEGFATSSLTTTMSSAPPTLIINPFHQAGGSVSLRNFTNTSFNQHVGIQTTERFGKDIDKDGDGVRNEMTQADVTAVTIFQATMAVPGRVIPNDPLIEQAIWDGERNFDAIGCTSCHVAALPLDKDGWVFVEPNPFNSAADLRPTEAPEFRVDLNDPTLPQPRLAAKDGVVWVSAYTDMKLHNITNGPDDPNCEALDMNAKLKSPQFFKGNCRFLTRKLWGAANEPPYFHNGLYTTLREATLAHAGEALPQRQAFEALDQYGQASIIEFLKSLQVLPPGTQSLVIDENGQAKAWPPVK